MLFSCLFIFTLCQEKDLKPGLCLLQTENILWLNLHLFYYQIDKNHPLVKQFAKYIFFHRCSYKNRCLSKLVYNSSFYALLWILCFWFWMLVVSLHTLSMEIFSDWFTLCQKDLSFRKWKFAIASSCNVAAVYHWKHKLSVTLKAQK